MEEEEEEEEEQASRHLPALLAHGMGLFTDVAFLSFFLSSNRVIDTVLPTLPVTTLDPLTSLRALYVCSYI